MNAAPPTPDPGPSARSTAVFLTLLAAFLFAVRLLGPSNLTDNDQERPASYVLDVLCNGHRFVQYDWTGDITSKPPFYTWLAAGVSALAGGTSLATLYLPCGLAMLAAALLTSIMLRPVAGNRAAFLAGFFVLANPLTAKLVALARTDAVFTGMVTLTAALAFAAWQRPRPCHRLWLAAWFAAALATLTKGPLGLLLGFAGLLAWIPERRSGTATPTPAHRVHLAGILLWTAVCGGWFLLAWRESGDALIRKMIHSELVGHALHREGPPPGVGLVVVPAYLLGRFAPWSLLTVWGLWTAFRRPEAPGPGRALQRFAAAWLLVGLITLGLASHQRGDLVAPLLPAAALLGAFPAARLLQHWTTRRILLTTASFGLVFGVGLELQRTRQRPEVFEQTRGMATLARRFVEQGGNPATLAHTDTPFALQWNLRTMHRALDWSAAARHLQAPGSPGVSVTATGLPQLLAALGTNPAPAALHTLAQWPENGPALVRIVSLARAPQ